MSLKRELLQMWNCKNLPVYDSENEASIFETKKVENFEHQFLDRFKSILVILLILLESAPQTLSNGTKMNKVRPILIKRQQFENLVHRFLKRTLGENRRSSIKNQFIHSNSAASVDKKMVKEDF